MSAARCFEGGGSSDEAGQAHISPISMTISCGRASNVDIPLSFISADFPKLDIAREGCAKLFGRWGFGEDIL